MSRISIPAFDDTNELVRPILKAVRRRTGFVSNLHRLMSVSPAALTALSDLEMALEQTFDIPTRQAIALAVADVGECGYCTIANTFIAANHAKISIKEIGLNSQGHSSDYKRGKIVGFARKLASEKGHIDALELVELRQAGVSDAQIVEIIALTALQLFANFISNAIGPEMDYPDFYRIRSVRSFESA